VEMLELSVRALTSEEDLNAARGLLYEVYIQEMKWEINQNNPSELSIEKIDNGKMILTDKYDKFSFWIGIFDREKLIACGRASRHDENFIFEANHYCQNEKLGILLKDATHVVELNRSAIHPDYRGTAAWLYLLHTGFDYCQKNKLSAFSTTGIKKVIDLHKAIGFPCVENLTFKYDPNDEKEVCVYFASYDKQQIFNILQNLNEMIRRL
jgi:hypothetical protein